MALAMAALAGEVAWGFASTLIKVRFSAATAGTVWVPT